MQLIPLLADLWKMDGGVAFGVVPKSLWNRNHMSDDNNMIPIVTRCLLVKTEDRNILIDVGMGSKREDRYYSVRYREPGPDIIDALGEIGLRPEDITDILLTHLHDDHVGAATRKASDGKIELVFPHARYYCSAAQWEWAVHPNKREGASYFPDNLYPLLDSGQLHFITEGGEFLPGIRLRITNGHTMGHIVPMISWKNKTIVYTGDFIPTAYNIPLPFVPAVDIQPLLTMQEKSAFLEEAVSEGYVLFFEHDYFQECCTLTKTEKGVVADQTFMLSEIMN